MFIPHVFETRLGVSYGGCWHSLWRSMEYRGCLQGIRLRRSSSGPCMSELATISMVGDFQFMILPWECFMNEYDLKVPDHELGASPSSTRPITIPDR